METLYVLMLLAPFVWFIGYQSRYVYGTKRITRDARGYEIVSIWGSYRIENEDIVKEENALFMKLTFGFTYGPFITRYYCLRRTGGMRVVTVKGGRIKYHIFPIKSIKYVED